VEEICFSRDRKRGVLKCNLKEGFSEFLSLRKEGKSRGGEKGPICGKRGARREFEWWRRCEGRRMTGLTTGD